MLSRPVRTGLACQRKLGRFSTNKTTTKHVEEKVIEIAVRNRDNAHILYIYVYIYIQIYKYIYEYTDSNQRMCWRG